MSTSVITRNRRCRQTTCWAVLLALLGSTPPALASEGSSGGPAGVPSVDPGGDSAVEPGVESAPATDAESRARAYLDLSDQVIERLVAMRGHRPTAPILRDVQRREALRARLDAMIDESIDPADIARAEWLLKALGLLAPEVDYRELSLSLMESQIAGFYDPKQRTFYIMDDGPAASQEPVMSHELFHAIQDVTWGVERYRGHGIGLTDYVLARTAVIEGDATAVMLEYASPGALGSSMVVDLLRASSKMPPEIARLGVPRFLWEQLLFPYMGGLELVSARWAEGGWPAVDALYGAGPVSTEQVLHPERVDDAPTFVTFESPAGWDGEAYSHDIVGEFTLGAMLAQLLDGELSPRAAGVAAAGWDGDRLIGYRFAEDPGRAVIAMAIVWDDAGEAKQFVQIAAALGRVWTPEVPEVRAEGPHGERRTWTGRDRHLRLERWGDRVLLYWDHGGATTGEARAADGARMEASVRSTLARWRYPDIASFAARELGEEQNEEAPRPDPR